MIGILNHGENKGWAMRHWLDTISDVWKLLYTVSPDAQKVRSELHETFHEILNMNVHLLPDWNNLEKPIMALDFDGVISNYKNGWHGPDVLDGDEPNPGAIDFIEKAVIHFTVLIFSSRCNTIPGQKAIEKWLKMYKLSDKALASLVFQPGKPSAFVIIDDRAICFEGTFGDPELIKKQFRPWYYDKPGWRPQK